MFNRFSCLARTPPTLLPRPSSSLLSLSRPLASQTLLPPLSSSSPLLSSSLPSTSSFRYLSTAKHAGVNNDASMNVLSQEEKERLEKVHVLVHLAAQGRTSEARELLNEGVDVNWVNNDQRSALHLAASEGHLETVKLLVERGAEVNAVDRFGATPLTDSFSARRSEIASFLKRHGAHLGENEDGLSHEMCDAAASGNLILLESVLENSYVKLDQIRDYDYRTPLHLAAANGHEEVVRLLLSKGADPRATDRFGHMAHEDAERGGFKSLTDYLRTYKKFNPESPIESGTSAVSTEELAKHYNTVKALLLKHRLYSEKLITQELDFYYHGLGFPALYFQRFPPEQAYRHVETFIAAKQVALANGTPEDIAINGVDSQDGTLFICSDEVDSIVRVEEEIEGLQARWRRKNQYLSLFQFKSTGSPVPGGSKRLSLYIVDKAKFPSTPSTETRMEHIASPNFSAWRTQQEVGQMEEIMIEATSRISPVFAIHPNIQEGVTQVMFAHRRDSYNLPVNLTTKILKANGVETVRKVIEQFGNGITIHIMSFPSSQDEQIKTVVNDLSLMMIAPVDEVIMPLYLDGHLNAMEYALCGVMQTYAYYFMSHEDEDLEMLFSFFKNDHQKQGRLENLRKSLRQESVSRSKLGQVMYENPEILKEICRLFQAKFAPKTFQSSTGEEEEGEVGVVEGFDEEEWEKDYEHVLTSIRKITASDQDQDILEYCLSINKACVKTNFFKVPKPALSFRLDPSKLKQDSVSALPFGIFLMSGNDFHGFHVRFNDVARGGLRLVFSRDRAAFARNEETAYFENYNLAHTQNRKNKDIPEFGSKGVLLLHPLKMDSKNQRYAGSQAFKKYISSFLDLIISHDEVNDYYGKNELIFCGPDENTADLMEWAAYHSKRRGYPYWKAFTTGKPQSLGGIPHDIYGMTTTSVHQYVLEILKDHGLKEEEVTKLQTGGPDGDLGSNEILISKDKTIGIVDGSGVLYDPEGIDRECLSELAHERKMIDHFDESRLSPNGFKVLVSQHDVTLPDGTVVPSGLAFRNEFHLSPYSSADLFVPCGGRPESVNQKNVHRLFNEEDGSPRFKYVVEGANLFITPEARSILESKGVVVFKDASSNKGGVTSSSLEVLAALAFTDEEHTEHMCFEEGEPIPEFYQKYVAEVQRRIRENAQLEYHCLMKEHKNSGEYMNVLTDLLSDKINQLHALISDSNLYNDEHLRHKVMAESIPIQLQHQIDGGLDEILNRLPENYVKTVFCTHLASLFVYQSGLSAGDFAFFEFMEKYNSTPPHIEGE